MCKDFTKSRKMFKRGHRNGNLLYDSGSSNWDSVTTQRGGMGWDGVGGRREIQEGGDGCICIWLIPVDVWQKPTQFCEAIILQLKS